jgi:hypothetical protein
MSTINNNSMKYFKDGEIIKVIIPPSNNVTKKENTIKNKRLLPYATLVLSKITMLEGQTAILSIVFNTVVNKFTIDDLKSVSNVGSFTNLKKTQITSYTCLFTASTDIQDTVHKIYLDLAKVEAKKSNRKGNTIVYNTSSDTNLNEVELGTIETGDFVKHWTGAYIPQSQNTVATDVGWSTFDELCPNPKPISRLERVLALSAIHTMQINTSYTALNGPGSKLYLYYKNSNTIHPYTEIVSGNEYFIIGNLVKTKVEVDSSIGVTCIKDFNSTISY